MMDLHLTGKARPVAKKRDGRRIGEQFSRVFLIFGMLCAALSSRAEAQTYQPVGPQENVPVATVTGGGWTECARSIYANSSPTISSILSACGGTHLMLACRRTGSSTLTLLAQAPKADVTTFTGSSNNGVTHTANGSEWYYSDNWSWGFAAAGDSVTKFSCDTASTNPSKRLCFHTRNQSLLFGYRCGSAFLNSSTTYERVFFTAGAGAPDSTPPTIDALPDLIVSTDTGSAFATVSFTPVASDNSGVAPILSYSIDGGSSFSATKPTIFPIGVTNVVVRAADGAGNTADEPFSITVNDDEPPQITPPAPVVVEATAAGGFGVATFAATAIDNVDGAVTPTYSQDPGTLFPLGTTQVTVTATDFSGNSGSETFDVVVQDTTPPTAVGQNITVQLDALGNPATIVAADVDGGSTDLVGIQTLSVDKDTFTAADLGANTVTLTVTDTSGNTATATAIVTVEDNVAPVITPVDRTVQLDANGLASVTVADVSMITDNVAIQSSGVSPSSFSGVDLGPNTVTITATDTSSNTSSNTALVTVEDLIAPTAVAQGKTVELDANGAASITAADIDNGSSDNDLVVSTSLDVTDFTGADLGDNTVTLTVTDRAGNSATATAVVTVVDVIAPTAVAQDVTVDLDANGQANITAAQVDGGSSDNVGVDTLSVNPSSFTGADLGQNSVTLTVTDSSGNSSSDTATVTVRDVTAPMVVAQNITVQLDANGDAGIVAADVDGGTTDNVAIQSLSVDRTSFTGADIGPNTVTLTATDTSGNSASTQATVTVEDNVAPVVAGMNITVELDENGAATITAADIDDGSFDNVGIQSLSVDPSSFSGADLGANTVTLTVTDTSGNIATTTATVTVVDRLAPIVIAQNITVDLDAAGAVTITAADVDGGTTDNVEIDSLSVAPSSFTGADLGDNTVTLTATDTSGNVASAQATVTVQDVTPPVVLAQNITVSLDASGAVTIAAADVDAGTTDNVAIQSLSVSPSSFTGANLGANVVTLTATDTSGNSANTTATVTVVDDAPPIALAQNVTVELDETGAGTLAAQDVDAGSTDNVGIQSLSVDPSSFTGDDLGPNTVTLTVTDTSGNSSTATATATVVDRLAPIAVAQNITISLDAAGLASIIAADVDGGSTDNVAITSASVSPFSFTGADVGPNTVTLTVTDASGNSATATAVVTVEDTSAPIVVTQNVSVALDATGAASITAADVDGGTTDNVGIQSLSVDPSSFTVANLGANTVTLTATDVNGNSASATATVTVTDDTPPSFASFPSDIFVQVDFPDTSSVVTWAEPTADDNSGVVEVVQTAGPSSGSSFGLTTTTIAYTATDAAENSVSDSFTVTVEQIPPGVVRFVVNAADDGAYTFSAEEPGFNFTINALGGSGEQRVTVRPGVYPFAFTVPTGTGVANASCSAAPSTIDAASQTGSATVSSEGEVTCVIDAVDALGDTVALIGDFMESRSDLILQEQPDAERRISRLEGAPSGASGGFSGFGFSGVGADLLPFAAQISEDEARFAFSLAETRARMRAAAAQRRGDAGALGFVAAADGQAAFSIGAAYDGAANADGSSGGAEANGQAAVSNSAPASFDGPGAPVGDIDFWIEGKAARFEAADGSGEFYIGQAGIDVVATNWLLLGVSGQVDMTNFNSDANAAGGVDGVGFLVGPYATARLADGLYADARAAWGESENEVSPFGTYVDDVDTERWLASGALIGRYRFGGFTFQPEARGTYYREVADSYTDSLGVYISSVELEKAEFSFGPTISYDWRLDDAFLIAPEATVKGVWTHSDLSAEGGALANEDDLASDGLRARFELGVSIARQGGFQLGLSSFYDGVGDADFEAYGGSVEFKLSFP